MDRNEQHEGENSRWSSALVYLSQIVIIYIVIIGCLVSLALKTGPQDVYISLMSTALGLVLPNPQMKAWKPKPKPQQLQQQER